MLDRCLSFLPSNSTTVIDGPSPPRIFNKQRGAHLIDRALQPLVGLLRELLYSLTVGEWSSVYTVYIFPPIQLKKDMSLQFVPSINFRNYIKKKTHLLKHITAKIDGFYSTTHGQQCIWNDPVRNICNQPWWFLLIAPLDVARSTLTTTTSMTWHGWTPYRCHIGWKVARFELKRNFEARYSGYWQRSVHGSQSQIFPCCIPN